MIKIIDLDKSLPYATFKFFYKKAISKNQKNIEAISISSYSKESKEVNSRFVNLKFINKKEFIFFSNYNSPKSKEFNDHHQITALIYWSAANVQIRIKAYIKKTPIEYNKSYFKNRTEQKNALAISSYQSDPIASYDDVVNNYNHSLQSATLNHCPEYWGGYSFTPYYFEFWEGHESRLNKRQAFTKKDNQWSSIFLQP